eukprot:6486014-Amphidinium_carterae.1
MNQDAVQKLHSSLGKASKNLIVEAAAMVESWLGRLHAYIRDVPAQLECNEIMEGAWEHLDSNIEDALQSMTKTKVLSKMAKVRESLRATSAEVMEKQVVEKITVVTEQVLAKDDGKLLNMMQEFLSEAVIAFPMSQPMEALKLRCGESIAGKEVVAAVAAFHQTTQSLMACSTPESLWPSMDTFVTQTGLVSGMVSKDMKDAIKKAFHNVLNVMTAFMSASSGETSTDHKDVTIVSQWILKVADLIGIEGLVELSLCFEDALKLHFMCNTSTSAGDGLSVSHTLRVGMLQLQKNIEGVKTKIKASDNINSWLAPPMAVLARDEAKLKQDTEELTTQIENDMDKKRSELHSLLAKMEKWTKNSQSCTLAKESLMTMNPKTLEESCKNLEEVMVKFNKLYDILGESQDPKHMREATKMQDEAYVLIRVGMIMHAFQKESAKTKLRDATRVPYKELKTKFGVDKQVSGQNSMPNNFKLYFWGWGILNISSLGKQDMLITGVTDHQNTSHVAFVPEECAFCWGKQMCLPRWPLLWSGSTLGGVQS